MIGPNKKGFAPMLKTLIRILLPAALLTTSVSVSASAFATDIIKPPTGVKLAFRYDGGEISAMIAAYSKATGQKFIIDPGVRGKATVLLPGDVSAEEAFNILCDVLSINGYSLFEQGDTYIVKSARNAQRDAIPTFTEVPPPRPNRMVTWIATLKYIKVEEVNKRLRILPSKDGEMTPFEPSNQLIISDYSSNINRIAHLIQAMDTPEAAKWKSPKAPAVMDRDSAVHQGKSN
jgi:type II secretory pathway component GspD/PulD (secretin)